MKKVVSFICCLYFAMLAKGQSNEFVWAGAMEGMVQSKCIAVDAAHNVYTTGCFGTGCSMDDFDPGPGISYLATAGGNDIFISKLDSMGNFVWAKQIGSGGSDVGISITLDHNGDICVTGVFSGFVDFDPGSATNYVSGSSSDIFILKLDAAGNFIWVKTMGSIGYDAPSTIVVDKNDNIYIAGSFEGTFDFDPGLDSLGYVDSLTSSGGADIFIAKFNALGDHIWAKRLGGTNSDAVYSMVVDTSGYVYSTGDFIGTSDFDPGSGTYNLINASSSTVDIFISKLDSLGNFVWAKSINGPAANDDGLSIAVDKDGAVYTTGEYINIVDFDPGPGVFNLSANSYPATTYGDAFILKLDAAGNFVWVKDIKENSYDLRGTYILVDKNKNIYVSGAFWGTTDFDPSLGVHMLTSNGGPDAFIAQYDSTGALIWVRQLGSVNYDQEVAMFLDNEQSLYNCGGFGGTIDFDPGIGVHNIASSICGSFYVLKLGSAGVWPGDANHDFVADNTDLLPIGLFYGETGTVRDSVSNMWQGFKSEDWNVFQADGFDIKHADCNGDGLINDNDTLAVNLNFSLTHAFTPEHQEARITNPDLYFVTSASAAPGSMVDFELWAGNSSLPVTDLYGLSFVINYDASLVQSATEVLTFPSSWFATPGTDGIKLGVVDALASKVYGAETRIDHFNTNGFGKIADFKFQLKSSIPTNTIMNFSISNYTANDANGNPLLFNTMNDSILVTPFASVSEKDKGKKISVYPNPANNFISIYLSESIKDGTVEIYNLIGELIHKEPIEGYEKKIDFKDYNNGIYFLKILSENKIVGMQKIIKQ